MMNLAEPFDDGLPIAAVNEWSRDKHHFLRRYIDAFVTAMANKWSGGLHFVDLFAGCGIERLKDSNTLEWGSPLIAAQAIPAFRELHLCELDPAKHAALAQRLSRLRPDCRQPDCGDGNVAIHDIVRRIPPKSLSVAFLDPFRLRDLRFETITALSTVRADLIIYFPDALDIVRNWAAYYYDNPESPLDQFLGSGANWRTVSSAVQPDRVPYEFLRLFKNQLRTLGYTHFEQEPIPSQGQRMYRLVYASRHEAGARIWRNTSQTKPGGQRTLSADW